MDTPDGEQGQGPAETPDTDPAETGGVDGSTPGSEPPLPEPSPTEPALPEPVVSVGGAGPEDARPTGGTEADRPGLPWEAATPGITPAGALETVRLVLFAPSRAFSTMKRTGGLGPPLIFLVMFGTAGLAVGLLWQAFVRSWIGSIGGGDLSQLALMNQMGVLMLFLAPILIVLFAAIGAGIFHLFLMMFGGAPQPIETTLRVVCYTSGATYLFQLIPICGGIVASFWGVVVIVIGLREAQGVPGGRAAAAVLVPTLLMCVCWMLLAISLFGLAVLPEAIG